jgi:hypothetical protein
MQLDSNQTRVDTNIFERRSEGIRKMGRLKYVEND